MKVLLPSALCCLQLLSLHHSSLKGRELWERMSEVLVIAHLLCDSMGPVWSLQDGQELFVDLPEA